MTTNDQQDQSEIWKDVPGYETYLQVSNYGRIYRKPRKVAVSKRKTTTRPGKIANFEIHLGYQRVLLMVDKKLWHLRVHRLVALAFVPGFAPGLTVNHINGDKFDNCASNLEWVSNSENVRHGWRNDLCSLHGERNPCSKLTVPQVTAIRTMFKQGVSTGTIAVLMRVSRGCIRMIVTGKRWAHLPV